MTLSIIIPLYNPRMAYLRECLDSVINQDYNDYEVILINDGSTDISEKICLEYVSKHNCFQYIYQENKGLGEARNTGLDCAKGTYVLFLDSDDAIEKNCIKKLVLFAEKKQADMVYFDEVVCDEQMSALFIRKTYSKMESEINKLKALELSMHPAHICARLYRRDLFENVRFASIWYEDMEIFPRLLSKAQKINYYKVPIYYYRQHEGAITRQEYDDRNLDVITAWINVYTKVGYSDEEKKAVEISLKKSICTFVFFRRQYATAYVDCYNNLFRMKTDRSRKAKSAINIEHMPLWQQADFYDKSYIIDILKGLREVYQNGGVLRFGKKNTVDFQKMGVGEEEIVFLLDGDIVLHEIRFQCGNPVISDVINELSQWNLVSMKNQLKTFNIAPNIMEKAMLHGIRIKLERGMLQ